MDDELAAPTAPVEGGWRVGADIGGTFTDVVALGPRGQVVGVKVLSTPPTFDEAVVAASTAALAQGDAAPGAVATMLHGTTVATNAILELDGARTAVVTTRGFRDVLELGRLRRPLLYDLGWSKPTPLARRRHRVELDQRITATGALDPPAADADVDGVADRLREAGIEAVAVCLVNAHVRPDEERRVAARLAAALPGVYVSASVDLSPEPGEFERTSTATVNSFVGPVVHRYLTRLARSLRDAGVAAPLQVMQSSGGLLDASLVAERPVTIIESGPAAGVTAAAALADSLGLDQIVAFDMGGTTAKASLIEGRAPLLSSDYEVGGGMNIARGLGSGAGYPVRAPSVDIAEVGSGGGSIVSLDLAGALHVGPASAGSRPGPACYGQGGDRPTLTDANVVLGYLSAESLAGGRVAIHADQAHKSLDRLAEQGGGTDPTAVAHGAYRVAVAGMTTAVKAVTSERGRDPRDTSMIAFGGAGPLYAAALARELGIGTVVVPRHPGLFSSLGLLVADVERHAAAPHTVAMQDPTDLERAFAGLEDEVREALAGEPGTIATDRALDMRYRGQRFELRIPVPAGPVDADVLAAVHRRFHAEHERTYGRRGADHLVEPVTVRVRGHIANPVGIEVLLRGGARQPRPPRRRGCWFDGPVDTRVIDRDDLAATPVPGPLVVEDMDATTLVPPGAAARRDPLGNIVITWSRP